MSELLTTVTFESKSLEDHERFQQVCKWFFGLEDLPSKEEESGIYLDQFYELGNPIKVG